MKKTGIKRMLFTAVLAAGCALATAVVGLHSAERVSAAPMIAETQRIADNVSIGGVDVSGMTADEARDLILTQMAGLQNTTFTLTAGEKSMQVTGMDLGLTWGNPQVVEEAANVGKSGNLLTRYKNKKDLEQKGKSYDVIFTIDDTETAALLNANEDKLGVKAQNAGLVKTANGFEMTGGQTGVTVDVAESLQNIKSYIADDWNGTDAAIALATVVTEPVGSANELSRVKDVLGSFHTDFSSSSAARCTNVERAASLINGSVIYPGETFSVVDTIGPTDAENGYELAGAYENGQTVEAYGGGVCQVSTTLYNAVLFAELEIVERYPHSMLVSYVDPSRDAAIAVDSGKNFQFKNNTDAPIYIEGYTANKQLYFTIYGEEYRPENRTVSYESEVLSETEPTTVFVATADPIGHFSTTSSAHIGKNAELWKIVTVNGQEESREKVNSSSYRATPKTVAVGIASLDPSATAAVSSAIASGNSDLVYATVAAYTGVGAVPAAAVPSADAAAAQAAIDAAAAADVVPMQPSAEEQAILAQ